MIIEGGSRRNARWFATHLQRTDGGQRVTLAEVRGLVGETIPGWFRQMEAMALGTRGENFFYHANINPREDEELTEAQWEKATDLLEQQLGLEGHSRFVVQHEKEGRTHRHVFWSRVDAETNTLTRDSNNYAVHMKTAAELEKLFGHEPTERGRGPEGPNPKNYEVFRGKKAGRDPYDVAAEVRPLYRQADSGQAFAAALDERGYILCEGDRGLCIIDQAAKEHSLYRRVGLRKAEVDARMAGIDRESLPSVAEARAMARERKKVQTTREEATPDPAPSPAPFTPAPVDPSPTPRRTRSRFGEFLGELAEGIKNAFKRKEVPQLTMGERAPAEASTFDRIAENLATSARESGPAPGELALGVAVLGAEQVLLTKKDPLPDASPSKALSPFERMVQLAKQAMRDTTGDDALMTAGLDWLARQRGAQHSAGPPPDQDLTPFDRMAEETKDALRENGGQPYTLGEVSFWQRTRALATSVAERIAGWIKESWQELVSQFTRARDPERDEPGFER